MIVPITVVEEIVCLSFSVVYLKNRKAGWWRNFIWFMLVTVLIEIAGWILSLYFPRKYNHWLYNIEMIIEVLFVTWVFYKILQPLFNSKPWLIAGLAVLFISYGVECVSRKFLTYNAFTDDLAAVFFVIASGAYFYFLLKSEEYVKLLEHPQFWVVAGIFFFYFGSTAVNLFFDDLMNVNIVRGFPVRLIIFPVVNAILYGCWSYSFRCRYLQTISSY
jgi:uncharacterized membrane protein YfcA